MQNAGPVDFEGVGRIKIRFWGVMMHLNAMFADSCSCGMRQQFVARTMLKLESYSCIAHAPEASELRNGRALKGGGTTERLQACSVLSRKLSAVIPKST